MKKIGILLIAFLLLGSFAFGQEEDQTFDVDFSGDASVTFGYDLEEETSGFLNDSSAGLDVTFVPEQTLEADGDGWYGHIALDFELVNDGEDLALTDDVSTARITNGTVYIDILEPGVDASAVSSLIGGDDDDEFIGTGFAALGHGEFLDTFENEDEDFNSAGSFGPEIQGLSDDGQGITFGYGDGAVEDIYLSVISDGNWRDNADNDYGVATGFAANVDPVSISSDIFVGLFDDDVSWASASELGVDVGDTGATLGFDLGDAGDDVEWASSLTLSQALAEGTSVELKGAFDDDEDVDAGLTFVEDTEGGLAPAIGASLGVGVFDITDSDASTLGVLTDLEYSEGGLNPFANVGFHQQLGGDENTFAAYEVGLTLSDGLHGIDNTEFTARYGSWDDGDEEVNLDDIHAGFVTLETAISY